MREIKFRGKTLSDEWIEGLLLVEASLNHHNDELGTKHFIVDESQRDWSHDCDCLTSFGEEILPKTTGQYTSRKDINDKEIYEGDIVRAAYDDPFGYQLEDFEDIGTVIWNEEFSCFSVEMRDESKPTFSCFEEFEILGNIYDNPELLGKDDNHE